MAGGLIGKMGKLVKGKKTPQKAKKASRKSKKIAKRQLKKNMKNAPKRTPDAYLERAEESMMTGKKDMDDMIKDRRIWKSKGRMRKSWDRKD